MENKLKIDLKRLANSALASNLSKHLTEYEAKVKEVVRGLKSRETREISKERLDRFISQVKKTTVDLEKKMATLANQEGHRLNQKVAELVTYLKSISGNEKGGRKASGSSRTSGKRASSSTNGEGASKAKKSSPQKRRAQAKVKSAASFSDSSSTTPAAN